jgi:hypothetical protein
MRYGSSFADTESGVRINEVRGGPRAVVYVIALVLNPLRPNDPYIGRTALLTSKVAYYIFIQQI